MLFFSFRFSFIFFFIISLFSKNLPANNLLRSKLIDIIDLFNEKYIYPEKIDYNSLVYSGLVEIETEIADLIVLKENNGNEIRIKLCSESRSFSFSKPNDKEFILNQLELIFNYINSKTCFPVPVKDTIIEKFFEGFVKNLDPHTRYFNVETFGEFSAQTFGTFGGIGINFSFENSILKIEQVFENSPAELAGLFENDVIVMIDKTPTNNLSRKQIINLLRGTPSSIVELQVKRKDTLMKFSIKRNIISIKPVEGNLSDGIGHIKIKKFQKGTAALTKALIEKFILESDKKFKGLILDLRDNPGGLLEEAIYLSDFFLKEGEIVTIVSSALRNNVNPVPKIADPSGYDFQLILLINSNSASASEILASAIKENCRGLLIGQLSFGKGTLQKIITLQDNSGIKITNAEFFGPRLYQIQSAGIEPDISLNEINLNQAESNFFTEKNLRSEKNLENSIKKINLKKESKSTIINYAHQEKEDMPLGLSKRLLNSYLNGTTMEEILNEFYLEQFNKIETFLKSNNINWTIFPEKTVIEPLVKLKENTNLSINDLWNLEIEANNNDSFPLSRYRIRTESTENFFIREFLYGTIFPGNKFLKKFSIPILKGLTQGEYRVEFFQEDFYHEKKVFKSELIKIKENNNISFTYSFEIRFKDEKPTLLIKLKNKGKETLKNFRLEIKSEEKDFAHVEDPVRQELAGIKSQEAKIFSFNLIKGIFFWKELFNFNFSLIMEDSKRVFYHQHKNHQKNNFAGEDFDFPEIHIEKTKLTEYVDKSEAEISCIIKDKDPIEFFNVFLNRKKIFFSSEKRNYLKISLSEKVNKLLFVVKDSRGFMNEERYNIYR